MIFDLWLDFRGVAQLVEQQSSKLKVAGSIPAAPASYWQKSIVFCLTKRIFCGSILMIDYVIWKIKYIKEWNKMINNLILKRKKEEVKKWKKY